LNLIFEVRKATIRPILVLRQNVIKNRIYTDI